MKRALLSFLGGLAIVTLGVTSAEAATVAANPSGTMSAPSRVPGGATFFIRSVTPCPAPGNTYAMVRVAIQPAGAPAGDPAGVDLGKGTQAWLHPDGSWETTLQAPAIPADQPTMPFTLQAECVAHTNPSFINADTSKPVDNEDLMVATVRYFPVVFWSTSTGGVAAVADMTATPTTTTTAAPATTTSTIATSSTTTPPTTAGAFNGSQASMPSKLDQTAAARAAAIRSELEARGVDTSDMTDVALLASPVAAHRATDDGGLPWWSFALLTMLLVGSVVAWGARREGATSGL
ncbi:MAG: hypothetical protein QOD30_2022 [Actinomycetota bacterium]|jgi:hypothetical protein|nr:hypothetical protein [Actinomycetota bacterium]